MGKVATQPLPPGRSPPLRSGGQNQKWPTSGPGDYITPPAWRVPTASLRGGESEVAHNCTTWLHNHPRLGESAPHQCGGRIRGGAQVGRVATQPLSPGASPPLRSGGQNRKWPTSGTGGHITTAAWGVPTPSERWAESEVGHKWARWLHKPFRSGCPHRFTAGGRIRSGPQLYQVINKRSRLWGFPALRIRGQN